MKTNIELTFEIKAWNFSRDTMVVLMLSLVPRANWTNFGQNFWDKLNMPFDSLGVIHNLCKVVFTRDDFLRLLSC